MVLVTPAPELAEPLPPRQHLLAGLVVPVTLEPVKVVLVVQVRVLQVPVA